MTGYDRRYLSRLILEDRVHRNVYTDPRIFDLEMDRIFGRAWVYIGHASQVPKPGDFFTTRIGKQPVVVVRHTDGKVHVLYNRCGHRGAVVENLPSGNAKHFRCCYHGWVFKTNGELASVPLKNGYPDNFDLTDPMLGMVPVARSDDYRGFLFASLGHEGPDLDSYLVGAKPCIDNLIDRAPDGDVDLAGGVHNYVFDGNWKFQIENVVDHYHASVAHESTLDRGGAQFQRREGDRGGAKMAERGRPAAKWDGVGTWGFRHGHTYNGHVPMRGKRAGPVFARYKAALEARHGRARTREILAFNRHNTAFYPNVCIQTLSQHVRIIRPVSVDRTEIQVFPVRLKGAPEEMHRQVIRYLNVTHSAASLIQTDDMESFKRCQEGLRTTGFDWVMLARGRGEEARDGAGLRGRGTDELPMRSQFRVWKAYMTG